MERCDVVIIGAGPYGLSAAAHLKAIKGLEVRVFGEPMSFWEQNMPGRMLLRSPIEGSHLSDPEHALTLHGFHAAEGAALSCPLPRQRFVDYGLWFCRQIAPELDHRKVISVERDSEGFCLQLEDGETLGAGRVVVATGILPFARRPHCFDNLPAGMVSHTCEHRDLQRFAGRRVLIVGGGQSSLESAALLHEVGAFPEVIVRKPILHWSWNRPWLHKEPMASFLYAPADVGPAGFSHLIARPGYFIRLPRPVQDWLTARTNPAGGAAWLKPRLTSVPIGMGQTISSVTVVGDELEVIFNGGQTRRIDHLLLGTGYRVNISLYPFLTKPLLKSLARQDGFPQLGRGFESSVPGLHFLGAPAAWSFGPLMRFVAGTDYASQALAAKLKKSVPPRSAAVGNRKEEVLRQPLGSIPQPLPAGCRNGGSRSNPGSDHDINRLAKA